LVVGVGEFFVTGVGSLIGTKWVSLLFPLWGLFVLTMASILSMKSSASKVPSCFESQIGILMSARGSMLTRVSIVKLRRCAPHHKNDE
jgi:hypothetical protein